MTQLVLLSSSFGSCFDRREALVLHVNRINGEITLESVGEETALMLATTAYSAAHAFNAFY